MSLLSADPAKRRLQTLELIALAVLLPAALFFGARSWGLYSNVVACERVFEQGELRSHARDWPAAVACYRRCIALNPRFFPAYDAIADIQDTVYHDVPGAIRTLKDALPAIGGDVRTHEDLGYYYLKARNFRKAQDHLRIAAADDPTNLTCRGLLRRANEGLAKHTTL